MATMTNQTIPMNCPICGAKFYCEWVGFIENENYTHSKECEEKRYKSLICVPKPKGLNE